MIDNITGKAARINFRPLRLDTILRTNMRDRPLLMGWLLIRLIEAAQKLWPEFDPEAIRKPLAQTPFRSRVREEEGPPPPFRPRWWRRMTDNEEDSDDTGI